MDAEVGSTGVILGLGWAVGLMGLCKTELEVAFWVWKGDVLIVWDEKKTDAPVAMPCMHAIRRLRSKPKLRRCSLAYILQTLSNIFLTPLSHCHI